MKEKKQNRRYFIKSAIAVVFIGVAVLWDKMVSTQRVILSKKVVTLPFSKNKVISFHEDFIIINNNGETKVFSSKCTHLGCQINQNSGDKLLCPCHGSTFDLEGKSTKGPAVKPLERLTFEIDDTTNSITIKV